MKTLPSGKVETDLTDLKITPDGTLLPFGRDQVAKYFPNFVRITPQGNVWQNNPSKLDLPIELLGLSLDQIAEATFLPVEFPERYVQRGRVFGFTRKFGPGDVTYTVVPTLVHLDQVNMDLRMIQSYSTLEDEAHNVPKNERDAVDEVKTDVVGTGKIVFDPKLGLIRTSHIEIDAKGMVQNFKTGKISYRDLKTTEEVTLQK